MSVTRTSVKRPLTIMMIFVIVLMFGGIGYSKMPADLMPEIDIPVVQIRTTWAGAGPEDIDEEISKDLEKALSSVSNVKSTWATSGEGYSSVGAQFEYGTDVDELMNDIRSKVDNIKADFPSDVGSTTISKQNMSDDAAAYIIIDGEGSQDDIVKYAEDVVQRKFEGVDGVSSAEVSGGDKTQVNVVADPAVLSNYGVTIDTIQGILASSNKSYPYGSITQGEEKITIRGVEKIESLDDIKSIQIPTNSGETVSLDRICDVNYGLEDKEGIFKYNGKESVLIMLQKQQDANTVQIMKKIDKIIDKVNQENPSYHVEVGYTGADYINNSIRDVIQNLLISSIIAFFVILAFLKSGRASLVVAIAIPTSIVGAVALLYFTGETINMVTLSSLVIAVGMVVDNAIVVIENIFKYRQIESLDLDEAAISGAETVGNAVMASTLTTVAIFLPIMFTEGLPKIMFGALAKTLIFALTLSLIVALTLVPSVFAKLSGGKNAAKMKEKPSPIFDAFALKYQKLISLALKHKLIVILISLGMFILSIPVATTIGMDFMSMGDQGFIQVSIDLPDNLDLEPSDYYVSMAEQKIVDIPELDKMMTIEQGNSSAMILMMLTPSTERDRSCDEVELDVVERLKSVPDCEIRTSGSSGGGGSASVEMDMSGPDRDVLEVLAKQAEENLKAIPGFRNVTTTLSDGNTEAQFKIDKRKAQLYGINTASIASILRTSISGNDTTTVTLDGYTMDINLKLKESSIDNIEDIRQMKIKSTTGEEIPLGAFADIKMGEGVQSLSRQNGDYSVTISGKADGMDTAKANNIAMEAIQKIDMPKDYGLNVGGDAEEMNEAMSGLVFAMVIAIILVYMVMVAQFESFSRPFIIMFCIPFAFVGVIIALALSRVSLNIVGMLGVILLVGIVVNNGIVLIDYIEQLRKSEFEGSLEDLVAKGSAARLRPVLMTTLTTIIGMVPSALAFGEGGGMMQPLSIVVIGGLTVSTAITLVLIPTIYLVFDKIETSMKGKFRKAGEKISSKMDSVKKQISPKKLLKK